MIRFVPWLGLVVLLCACSGAPDSRGSAEPPPPAPPRILQFYAAPGLLEPGDSASLCYGVENATSVRVEPKVADLRPALTRCVPISPSRDTEYTLYVSGDGGDVSETITVKLAPRGSTRKAGKASESAPAASLAPMIHNLTANPQSIGAGGSATLCFQAEAERVRIEPPVFQLGTVTQGCFSVAPKTTTRYTVIAEAKGRSVRKSVEVTVQ